MESDPTNQPLPLEPPPQQPMTTAIDLRPPLPAPPPVRVIAVEDVTLTAAAEDTPAIDQLMTEILPLIKDPGASVADPSILGCYLAENARVIYRLRTTPPPPPRHVLLLELADLREIRQRLQDAEIEHELVKRLTPGDVRLALLDVAGNPIEILQNWAIL